MRIVALAHLGVCRNHPGIGSWGSSCHLPHGITYYHLQCLNLPFLGNAGHIYHVGYIALYMNIYLRVCFVLRCWYWSGNNECRARRVSGRDSIIVSASEPPLRFESACFEQLFEHNNPPLHPIRQRRCHPTRLATLLTTALSSGVASTFDVTVLHAQLCIGMTHCLIQWLRKLNETELN
jgi:hypothetical protein